jgi:hypothetical protein
VLTDFWGSGIILSSTTTTSHGRAKTMNATTTLLAGSNLDGSAKIKAPAPVELTADQVADLEALMEEAFLNPSLDDDADFAAGYEEWLDEQADAEALARDAEDLGNR